MSNKYINEDTYQTLHEVNIEPQSITKSKELCGRK